MEEIFKWIKELDILFVLAGLSALGGFVKWLRRRLRTYLMGPEHEEVSAPHPGTGTGTSLEEEGFLSPARSEAEEGSFGGLHSSEVPEDVRLLAVSPDEVSQRLAKRRLAAEAREVDWQRPRRMSANDQESNSLLDGVYGTLYGGPEEMQKAVVLSEILSPIHGKKSSNPLERRFA